MKNEKRRIDLIFTLTSGKEMDSLRLFFSAAGYIGLKGGTS
jgi:hypothetical protein